MKLYIILIISIYILAAIIQYMDQANLKKRWQNLFVVYIFLILSLISGLRYNVGTDYVAYKSVFLDSMNKSIIGERDFGYLILNKLIYLINDNPQFIFLVTSFIINGLVIYTLRKKSELFEISIYLYLTTFMYFSTFNGIRQWIASAILFSGINYLLNREFWKYSLVILLAATVHQTALIMFLFYFVSNVKFKSKRTLIIVAVGFFIYIFYMPFVDILMKTLEGSKVQNDYNLILLDGGNGANFIKFIVALVPVILSYIFYKNINKNNDMKIDILMNLSLINALIMLIGTRHWIFARFLMYFEIYNLILYPIILNRILKKERMLIYYFLIVFYFAFCILILKSGDSNIVPYKIC